MDTAVGRDPFPEVFNGRPAPGRPEFFGRSVIISSAPARNRRCTQISRIHQAVADTVPFRSPLVER